MSKVKLFFALVVLLVVSGSWVMKVNGVFGGWNLEPYGEDNRWARIGPVNPMNVFNTYDVLLFHDTTSMHFVRDTFTVKQGRPANVRSEAPLYVWGTGADGIMHTYNRTSLPYTMNPPTDMTSKSLNTSYQISTTKDYDIEVSAKVSCSLSLVSGQSGTIVLEISPNGSTGWLYKGQIDGSNTGTLTIGLNTVQVTGGQLSTGLPRGYYWRLRTINNTGTPTFSWSGGSQTEK